MLGVCRAILEVFEDRYGTRSTMTSQLPSKRWHEHIGAPTRADAICDGLLHNARKDPGAARPAVRELEAQWSPLRGVPDEHATKRSRIRRSAAGQLR